MYLLSLGQYMRRFLDSIYTLSAWLAGICMIGVLIMVLLTMLGRLLHFDLAGSDAYAGYFMAGAGFLALAPTLKHNEHIRVTLIIGKLTGLPRKIMEVITVVIAVLISGFIAFFSCRLMWQSYQYDDVSTGNDATPMWIPQIFMAVGSIIFFIAFVDEFITELKGQRVHIVEGATHE